MRNRCRTARGTFAGARIENACVTIGRSLSGKCINNFASSFAHASASTAFGVDGAVAGARAGAAELVAAVSAGGHAGSALQVAAGAAGAAAVEPRVRSPRVVVPGGVPGRVSVAAAVAISAGGAARAVAAAGLAVAVALRRARGTALRGRCLAARDRGLDLDALAEHVVVPVLQHDARGVLALKRDESEPARLVVVRVAHHQHLDDRAELREEVANDA